MKIKKIIGIAAIVVLCGIAVFSGVVFHHQYQDQKNSAQQFEDLSNMIADVDKSELDKEPVPEPGEDEPVSETLSESEQRFCGLDLHRRHEHQLPGHVDAE